MCLSGYQSGLTPLHFAAVIDKDLYENLKSAGGDCHTVDIEGNDPEYYKEHQSDFILDIEKLKEELLVTPPSRPVTAASETRAKSAKSTRSSKPSSAKSGKPAPVVNPPPVGMASKKKAPAPETLDAKYIADVLGSPLTAALAEVAEKRPWDPIEFLAQWLYKHKANLNYHQAEIDAVKEAENEEVRKKEEAESRARRKREAIHLKEQEEEQKKKAEEEARKQKEQEELQKKAKESIHLAQPPELATVAEDEEGAPETAPAPEVVTPRTVVEKDDQGRTQLHHLVAAGSIDEVKALLVTSGVDLLAEKDTEGKSAQDLAESDEMREAIAEYVVGLLKAEDLMPVSRLIENGFPLAGMEINKEDLPEASAQLLDTCATLKEKLDEIVKSITSGEVRSVKQCIDKKAMAVTRLNSDGATSLHLAVLLEKQEVVQYLVTAFPGIVQCRDHMNRTALHYAHGLTAGDERDAIIKLLVDSKSDEEAADCKGKKPTDFAELTDDITAMRSAVAALTAFSAPDEGAETAGGEGEAPATEGEAPAAEETPAAADPPAAAE